MFLYLYQTAKILIMKTLSIKTLPLLALLLVLSCTGNSKTANQQNEVVLENGKLPNPETSDKNSPEYKPAFTGQTRIEGLKTKTPYQVDVINSDLKNPWGIINLPDGRFLITSKSGYFNILAADGKTTSKVEGLPKVDAKGQGGLLDVALDPDFQNNRMVFWSFSEPYSGGNHTAVAKGKLSSDEKLIENPVVISEQHQLMMVINITEVAWFLIKMETFS